MLREIFNLIFGLSFLCGSIIESISIQNESFRLPNNSHPMEYDVWLKLNSAAKSTFFKGHVKIKIKILEESETVTIHSKSFRIAQISLTDLISSIKYENISYELVEQKDFLVIKLPFIMAPKTNILLDISYVGKVIEANNEKVPDNSVMLASYSNVDINSTKDEYIFVEFEPTNARTCFPCFDEPSKKAKFVFHLEHDSAYHAISNMPVARRTQSTTSESHVVTSFKETPLMSTYLLAFVISKFDSIQITGSRIPQNIYVRPSIIDDPRIKFLTEYLNIIFNAFEKYFGIPYSLPKLDHVIAPFFHSPKENWGLITYPENRVLKSDETAVVLHVLHELVHNHFGNLVTQKWWSYMWMKEGFAKYYEIELAKILFTRNFEVMEMQMFRRIKNHDENIDSKSLNNFAENQTAIIEKYSIETYYKGAAIIKMFQNAFGIDTWKKGLKIYLEDNQYCAVEPSDLHKAIQKAVDQDYPNNGLDVENIMAPWEDQAGIPIISISLENGRLKLSQKRKSNSAASNEIYSIPIFFASSSNLNFEHSKANFWMTEKEIEIENFNEQWIVIDIYELGYYDVEYDSKICNGLLDQLTNNHTVIVMPHREAFVQQFMEKCAAWGCNDLLKIFNYLKNEDDFEIITGVLLSVYDQLPRCLKYETLLPHFRNAMLVIYRTLRTNFQHSEMPTKFRKLALVLKIPVAIADYLDEMINSLNEPDINLRFPYCEVISHANASVIELFYNFTAKMFNQDESYRLLNALGCIENSDHYAKILNILIDVDWSGKYNEVKFLFRNLNTIEKKEAVLNFLEENYLKIAHSSPTLLNQILASLETSLNSQSNLERLDIISKGLVSRACTSDPAGTNFSY